MDANEKELLELIRAIMPFGKFKDRPLFKLPDEYLLWFKEKGFPEGKLGLQMQQILEMKVNGLNKLLFELDRRYN